MDKLPPRLGRYQLLDELGRGAMGAVYRALDPTIERHVAIKTVSVALSSADADDFRARFLKEAKAAGRLNHPNIVTIFDAGEDDGTAYIVMEYLTGASLRDIMVPGRPLPLAIWVPIAAQVAAGLACAHGAGVIHRDIKPPNIMVAADGRATITDFGIARMQTISRTQTGMILGSPKYMSPEQIRGLPLDQRSDIFSLGSVMFEMATGHPAFGAGSENLMDLMQEIAGGDAPVATHRNPDVPMAFESIIARALAKRPDDRYRSAAELAKELGRALDAAGMERTVGIAAPAAAVRPTERVRGSTAQDTVRVPRPGASDGSVDAFRAQLLADLDAFTASPIEPQASSRIPDRVPAAPQPVFPELRIDLPAEVDETTQRPAPNLLQELALEAAERRRNDQAPRGEREAASARALALDTQLRELFGHLNEFVRHLNIIRPPLPRSYEVHGVGALTGLAWREGFVDYRTRTLGGIALIARMTFTCQHAGAGRFEVEREGPAIEKLRGQLWSFGIPFAEEEQRNSRRLLERVRFRIPFELRSAALFEVAEDATSVHLQLVNVERLGVMEYVVAPAALGAGFFEELGKALLGKQHRMFAYTEVAPAPRRLNI